MNRRRDGFGRRKAARRVGLLATCLAGMIGLGPGNVGASPIRRPWLHRGLTVQTQATRWDHYYQSALQYHWRNVRVPRVMVRSLQPGVNGLLPQSALGDYLQWRHDLDPARFDFYHPFLGPLLERDQLLRNLSPTTIASVPPTRRTGIDSLVIPPRAPSIPSIPTSPEGLIPPQVPEPSSIWIALTMGGAVALVRGRRRP